MTPPRRVLLVTALSTASLLVLEISLTRLLSVLLSHSFVYAVLSVAVLGLSWGAACVALWPKLSSFVLLAWYLFSAAVFTLLTALTATLTMGASLWLLWLLTSCAFASVGMLLAALFARYGHASRLLYGFDLLGAGLGVSLAVLVLQWLGGLNALLLCALLFSVTAFLIPQVRRMTLLLFAVLVGLCLFLLTLTPLELDMARLALTKPITEQLRAGAEIIETRWDAFARTDLLYQSGPDRYYLYIDGGAGALVPDAINPAGWQEDIGRLAFEGLTPASALLIGSGGGLDVALAQQINVPDITVVEVNRASIQLVRELEAYAGPLYAPPVQLFADEGRSVLRREQRDYALIFLSQVISQAAEARGLVLAENKLYTREAFHDYFDHLSADGMLVLKLYDELTLTRALFTAIQVLSERGVSEAAASLQIFAFLDTRVSPAIPLLMVSQEALPRSEVIQLARTAERAGFALLLVPGLLAQPPLDALQEGRLNLATIIARQQPLDLRPVSDQRPFFYHFDRALPLSLQRLLGFIAVAVLALLLCYGFSFRRFTAHDRSLVVVVACLGLAFMMLELNVIQRVQLVLGHPTLALSLSLGVLLLGGGMGSLLASRLKLSKPRLLMFSALLVAVLWLLWSLLWGSLSAQLEAQGFGLRVALTALSLLPLALCLGIPFPVSLSMMQDRPRLIALSWSLNGFFSFCGSVLATSLAMLIGFQWVASTVVLVYLIASLLAAMIVIAGRSY